MVDDSEIVLKPKEISSKSMSDTSGISKRLLLFSIEVSLSWVLTAKASVVGGN